MALTVSTPYKKGGASIVRALFNDNLKFIPFTFVPSSSYTSSGDAVAAADMPAGYKDLISPWHAFPQLPYSFKLDTTNLTLWAYVGDTATGAHEVTGSTNLQTVLGTAAITIFFAVR
jgi:hypothetical protein